MKPQNHSFFSLARALPLLALLPLGAFGALIELSDTPISSAVSTQVRPNILFVMDDSLSMELDYLPDWAGGGKPSWATPSEVRPDYPRRLYQTRNPDFNGVTYDPAVTYVPPKYFNASGLADTASYPDQDRAQTNGWTAVKNDGYDVQYTSTMNLNGLAFYYTTVPGEYCTNTTLRTCIAATAPTTSGGVEYSVPAKLRWCKYNYGAAQTAPNGDCKAIEVDATKNATGTAYSDTGYTWARMPRPRLGVVLFYSSSNSSVSSVKVNFKGDDGVVRATEILSGPTAATAAPLTQAQQVADEINKCSFSLPSVTNCQMVGFRAEAMQYSSYGVVYILAPRDPNPGVNVAPAVTRSGSMATATYAFSTATSYVYASSSYPVDLFYQGYTTNNTSYAVPGDNVLTVITPSVNSYAKAASRTDCAGETCTYDEEMTNFANWWAYYRTRMQAMKSAASRSFEQIDERFRIGYYSINNNTSSDFRNIEEFDGVQKYEWYRKLFAATPYRTDTAMADTPLRVALSQAGHLFAGKLEKMNEVDVVDPMQHSCQANVTILSTDGYWNQGKGYKLDGTDVGEQDGYVGGVALEERPMLDGGIPILQRYTIQRKIQLTPKEAIWNQTKTTQWQVQENVRQRIREKVEQFSTSQLQRKEGQWEQQDWQLQIRQNNVYHYYPTTSVTSWEYQSSKQPLETASGPLQKRTGHLQKSTKTQRMRSNGQLQSQAAQMQYRTKQLQRRYTWVQQRTSDNGGIIWTGWANVASCTPVASGNDRVDCKTLPAGGYEDVTSGSCTKNAGLTVTSNAGTDNATTTYNTKVECQYTNPGYTLVAEDASCPATVPESTGDTLSTLNPVECVPRSGGWWGYKDVTSCTAGSYVHCMYVWTNPVADDSCASVTESYSPNYAVANPVRCTDDGWTAFADTNETCTVSSNVRCQYGWAADGSDWQNESSGVCSVNKSEGNTLTVIDATDCRVDVGTWSGPLDTCTVSLTGATRTQCRYAAGWTGWSGWSNTVCTRNDTPGNGPTYNALVQCNSRRGTTTSNDVCEPFLDDGTTPNPGYDSVGCTVCADSSHPDYAALCTSTWRDWANASSCTPSGNAGEPDAVECRYVLKNNWWPKSPGDCTASTPPLGFAPSNGTTLGAGTYNVGQPRYCQVNFNADNWQNATSCDANAENNGLKDIQCRYLGWSSWSVGACPSGDKAQSTIYPWTGPACQSTTDWTAYRELNNGENCPATNTPTVECEVTGDTWENYPRAGDTWDNFPNPPQNTATTRYREEIIMQSGLEWYPALSSKPTAGAGNLVTTSYGFNFTSLKRDCTAGADPDTGVVTYCEAHVPNASGVLNYLGCVPQESTTSEYGVEVSCPSAVESGRTTVTGVNVCTEVAPTSSNNYTETRCDPVGGTSTPDTLADIAEYYWKTDLRTPELGNCEVATGDVCANTDIVPRQNMRTFTLGLGASGVMQFQQGYGRYTDPNMEPLANPIEGGDIYSITMGIAANAASGICSWQTVSGPCSWPKPVSNQQTNIDDLWHAAINGRGTYFSAENPSAMASGISAALQEVLAKEGSRTPPTFDGKELKEDSMVFMAKFAAEAWAGDLGKFKVDLAGLTKGETIWSAKSLLDARAYTDRTIYTFAEAESGKLKPFAWGALDDDEKAMFTGLDVTQLSQLCVALPGCLPPALHPLAGGEALVNFLRGDRSNEGPGTDTAKYFRQRSSALGDIVNSGPVYVQKPTKLYSDPGYGEFAKSTAMADRTGMVYVGANDGMLHAFDAQTGAEAWAFVPGLVMGDLYHLADKSYSSSHRFFVDGTPVVGDVCVSGCDTSGAVWKTILVGGLNHGGRGYYALDVTDPASPKGLWEFTDANLGYSYGNPVISKLADGRWVVMVTSGYNNADGQGHLFILEAETGSKLKDLSTGVGSAAAPSGLAKIANFVNFPEHNNLTLRVYGGDLLGNLWRFDVNDFFHPDDPDDPDTDVQRLATLRSGDFTDENGTPHPAEAQPITSAPQLGMINNRHAVVFVGTGQLLGNPDLTTTGIQSLYGIKDPLTALDYGDPRTTTLGSFVEQVMGEGVCSAENDYCVTNDTIITVTKNAVDWATKSGWYVDFPVAGERVVNDIDLRDGILAITTNTPQSGVCTPAGTSDLYFLDYATGGYIRDGIDGMARFGHMDSLGSGLTVVHDKDGNSIVGQGNDNLELTGKDPPPPDITTKVRRISWRELIVE